MSLTIEKIALAEQRFRNYNRIISQSWKAKMLGEGVGGHGKWGSGGGGRKQPVFNASCLFYYHITAGELYFSIADGDCPKCFCHWVKTRQK